MQPEAPHNKAKEKPGESLDNGTNFEKILQRSVGGGSEQKVVKGSPRIGMK
jgi:hypothetical protein